MAPNDTYSTFMLTTDIEDVMQKFNATNKEEEPVNMDANLAKCFLESLNSQIINLMIELKEPNERIILQKLKKKFMNMMRVPCRKYRVQFKKTILLYYYRKLTAIGELEENKFLELLLMKAPSRDISGINQITLLTSPRPNGQSFSCKHDCFYCPNEPAHEDNFTPQPRS